MSRSARTDHHRGAATPASGQILPGAPLERITAGSGRQVDIIVGTNVDDWRLWLVVSGAIGQIMDEILTGPVRGHGYQCLAAYGLVPEAALAAYRRRYPWLGSADRHLRPVPSTATTTTGRPADPVRDRG